MSMLGRPVAPRVQGQKEGHLALSFLAPGNSSKQEGNGDRGGAASPTRRIWQKERCFFWEEEAGLGMGVGSDGNW